MHTGQHHTALRSCMGWAQADEDQVWPAGLASGMPTWLPQVPAPWRFLHDVRAIHALNQCIEQLMLKPVEEELDASGTRRLQVMGGFIYEVASHGEVSCYRWVLDDAGLEQLEPCKASTVIAEGGPFESRWTMPLMQRLRRLLNERHPHHALDVRLYTDWLMAALVKHHWTDDKAARVRAVVKDRLQLNPVVMHHVRTYLAASTGRSARMADYNRALMRQTQDARLLQEAPQLITLYGLIEMDLPMQGERPAAMKTYLQDNGIKPVTWRLLHQHGTGWMQAFMGYFEDSISSPQRAINLVHLLQLFGFQNAVHTELMHSLMRLRENPNSPVRSAEMWDEGSTLGGLLRRLGLLYEQGALADRQLIGDKLYHLVHWADQQQPAQAWLSRCTVSGLIRHVVDDQKLAQATLAHGQRWQIPCALTWPDDKFELVFLSSALDIWKEGQAMQHCAVNYIEVCAQGQEIMASIRPRAGGKALATASFQLTDEQVTLVRMSGFANSQVSSDLTAMAQSVATALTQAWQRQPLWLPA